jgi:hypothetical protein
MLIKCGCNAGTGTLVAGRISIVSDTRRSLVPAFGAIDRRHIMENAAYEFSAEQNEIILNLAKKMRFIGGTLVVLAVIYFAAGLFPFTRNGIPGWYGIGSICAQLIAGALYLTLGIFIIKAANSFRLIVQTEGNDIKNLMDALAFLLKNYRIQYCVIIVALILLVVALGFVVFWATRV